MSELKIIARHAGSVWAGQLAVMAFGVIDTVVAGRYSEDALAALAIGSAVYISVYVALMAVLQALLPIWAELHGGARSAELGRSVRQALYLCAVVSVLGLLVLFAPGPVLRWTQVPPAMQSTVVDYLQVLGLAFVPALLFRMYSTLNQSLGRPLLVTWLQLGALLFKLPLSIWLTNGGMGLPALGVVGCAWATVLVYAGMLVVALLMLRTQDLYRPYKLWQRMEKPHWHTIAGFLRLGVPTGLAVMVEVTSFTLMALFIARQGTLSTAAHQIASNVVALMYMLPLSIAIATSARTSYWMGARQHAQARHAIAQGFGLVATAALSASALVFLLRHQLAGFYANSPEVAQLAAQLLAWIALFHLADACQVTCGFLLRCFQIALAPLLIYASLLWGLGLFGGYVWAYVGVADIGTRPQVSTFWMASSAALYLVAALMLALLLRTVARRLR